MYRERTVANVLRPIFTVLMVFLLLYANYNCVVRYTVLNKSFWTDYVITEDFKEEFKDELHQQLSTEEQKDNFSDDLIDDLADYMIDELMNAIFDPDYKPDYDEYEEMFEESIEPELVKKGLNRAQIKECKDDLYDEDIVKVNETVEESFGNGFSASVSGMQANAFIQLTVVLIVIIVFEVVLILIHKNKFKPVRNLGIALTISQALATCGAALVLGFLSLAKYAIETGEELYGLLIIIFDNLTRAALIVTAIMGISLVISIVILVVFGILSGKKTKALNKKAAEERAANPSPYAYANNYNQYAQPYSDPNAAYNTYANQQYAQQTGPQVAPYTQQNPYQQQGVPIQQNPYTQQNYGQQAYQQPVQQNPYAQQNTQVPQGQNYGYNATNYGTSSSNNSDGSRRSDWDDELE